MFSLLSKLENASEKITGLYPCRLQHYKRHSGKKKPRYIHSKHHHAFYVDLHEYPKTTFCNSGIYLIPLDMDRIINNSNAGDSTEISVLTQDLTMDGLYGPGLTMLELKINGKEYLTLESLNAMLAEERPNQSGLFVNVIIILSLVILVQVLMVFGKQ